MASVYPKPSRFGLVSAFRPFTSLTTVVLATGLLISASSAHAATYYVEKGHASCSDTDPNAGTTTMPYCKIQAAVAARPGNGNIIIVQPGTYYEEVEITSGPFTLQANGVVTIDSSETTTNWTQTTDPWIWKAPVTGTQTAIRQVILTGYFNPLAYWVPTGTQTWQDLPSRRSMYLAADDHVYVNIDSIPGFTDRLFRLWCG